MSPTVHCQTPHSDKDVDRAQSECKTSCGSLKRLRLND